MPFSLDLENEILMGQNIRKQENMSLYHIVIKGLKYT